MIVLCQFHNAMLLTHVKLSLSNFNNEDNNENYKKSGSK